MSWIGWVVIVLFGGSTLLMMIQLIRTEDPAEVRRENVSEVFISVFHILNILSVIGCTCQIRDGTDTIKRG